MNKKQAIKASTGGHNFSFEEFEALLDKIHDGIRSCARFRCWIDRGKCEEKEKNRIISEATNGDGNGFRSAVGGAVAFWFEHHEEMVARGNNRLRVIFDHFFQNGPEPRLHGQESEDSVLFG